MITSPAPNEPQTLIKDLAKQIQLLACLQWLAEFQVLICVPVCGKVSFQDLASLTGVPDTQLRRVVRMAATAGILTEPETGYVAHTALSTQFVQEPLLLDAVGFLANNAVPAAMSMANATRDRRRSPEAFKSAFELGLGSLHGFPVECNRDLKLRHQFAAFQRLENQDVDANTTDVLFALDWRSLGNATVVEAYPPSLASAIALSERAPALELTVQLPNDCPIDGAELHRQLEKRPKIKLQRRERGTRQQVDRASVYVVHLPSPSPLTSSTTLRAQIASEIRAHSEKIRMNPNSSLILVANLIPEPGMVDGSVEAAARLYDLLLLQMNNEQALESSQLLEIIKEVQDTGYELAVVNRLSSRNHSVVAFELRSRTAASTRGSTVTA